MKLIQLLEYDAILKSARYPDRKNSPFDAYRFAKYVAQHRTPDLEPVILKNPELALEYTIRFLNGERWLEAEPLFLKKAWMAYEYAKEVIKDRWPEAEEIIKYDPELAFYYAKYIIKGRWPEAEKYIFEDPHYKDMYINQCCDDLDRSTNIPVVINYNVAITDLPNNTTNKQLQQLIKIILPFFNEKALDVVIKTRVGDEELIIQQLKQKSCEKVTLYDIQQIDTYYDNRIKHIFGDTVYDILDEYYFEFGGGDFDDGDVVLESSNPLDLCDLYNTPQLAYKFTRSRGPTPELEPIIMQSPKYSYYYAVDILERRWIEAEQIIQQDDETYELYLHAFPEAISLSKAVPVMLGKYIIHDVPNTVSNEQLVQLFTILTRIYNQSDVNSDWLMYKIKNIRTYNENIIKYNIKNNTTPQISIKDLNRCDHQFYEDNLFFSEKSSDFD